LRVQRTCLSLILIVAAAHLCCNSDSPTRSDGPITKVDQAVGPDGQTTDGKTTVDSTTASDGGAARPLNCSGGKGFSSTPIDRSCKLASDCIVVSHMRDCCGTNISIAINAKDKARFDAAEKICAATFPGCGCPSMPATTDDGSSLIPPAQPAATCSAGVCRTYVKGCGDLCQAGTQCVGCVMGPSVDWFCTTRCVTSKSGDCSDSARPKCQSISFGTYCTPNVTCGTP